LIILIGAARPKALCYTRLIAHLLAIGDLGEGKAVQKIRIDSHLDGGDLSRDLHFGSTVCGVLAHLRDTDAAVVADPFDILLLLDGADCSCARAACLRRKL
jgi:hypothetical protein